MSYQIDSGKVAGVVREVATHLDAQRTFNRGEIMVGLAEIIGRIIVDTASNHIAMKDMVHVVVEHLDRTIIAGSESKGKSLIERV